MARLPDRYPLSPASEWRYGSNDSGNGRFWLIPLIILFLALLAWGVWSTRNVDSETGRPEHVKPTLCTPADHLAPCIPNGDNEPTTSNDVNPLF